MAEVRVPMKDTEYRALIKIKDRLGLTWKQLMLKGADLPYNEEMEIDPSKQ